MRSVFLLLLILVSPVWAEAPARVLFVLTSHAELGDTGKSTGFYLSEVTHPYDFLTSQGYAIDFVSPLGGDPPMDGVDLEDPVNARLHKDPEFRNRLAHSLKPEEVDPERYRAIFYPGGHGVMWDLPHHPLLADLTARMYENGGVVAAVCHGPAALVNVKLSDGSYLVAGKAVAGFSNSEETAAGLDKVMPFLLESRLKDLGGDYSCAPDFQAYVVSDQRLITGQNPASARGVAEAIHQHLSHALAVREWQSERQQRLRKPDGWLSLAGLFWLEEGRNRFGSDAENELVFPEKTPPRIGTVWVKGTRVEVRLGIPVEADGKRVRQVLLEPGSPVLRLGRWSWHLIERDGRLAIRLRDAQSPTLLEFEGTRFFSVDPGWRLEGEFVAYPQPRQEEIPTVQAWSTRANVPGYVSFEADGKKHRLDVIADPGDEQFFVIFGDQTNGTETYGAGRFLYLDRPAEDGLVTIDFNRAYTPPCAFTPYATCPLPPSQNRLPFAVRAGEQSSGH